MPTASVKLTLDNSEFVNRIASSQAGIAAFGEKTNAVSQEVTGKLALIGTTLAGITTKAPSLAMDAFGEASSRATTAAIEGLAATARQASRTADALESAAKRARSSVIRLGERGGFARVNDVSGPNAADAVVKSAGIRQAAEANSRALAEQNKEIRMMTTEMVPLAQRSYAATGSFIALSKGSEKAAFSIADFGKKMAQTIGRILLPDWVLFKINAIASAMAALGGTAAVALGVFAGVLIALGAVGWLIYKKRVEETEEAIKKATEAAKLYRDVLDASLGRDVGAYRSVDALGKVEKSWKKINDSVSGYIARIKEFLALIGKVETRDKTRTGASTDELESLARRRAAELAAGASSKDEADAIYRKRDAYIAEIRALQKVKDAETELAAAREKTGVVSRSGPDDSGVKAAEAMFSKIKAENEVQLLSLDAILGTKFEDFAGFKKSDFESGGKGLDQMIDRARALRDEQAKLADQDRADGKPRGAASMEFDQYSRLLGMLTQYQRSLAEVNAAQEKITATTKAFQEAERGRIELITDAKESERIAQQRLNAAKNDEAAIKAGAPTFASPLDKIKTDKFDIIASSLAKVGGGGLTSFSGPGDPLLAEGKRQTAVLEEIRRNTAPRTSATATGFTLTKRP